MDTKDEYLFGKLLELIQRADGQISQVNQFYFAAIGSLIPILAFLVQVKVHWLAYPGICLLGFALGLNWLTVNVRLSLQKFCWVEIGRSIETNLFDPFGPFTHQKNFFDNLHEHKVSWVDRLLQRIGTANFKYVPMITLVSAVAIACVSAFVATESPRGLRESRGDSRQQIGKLTK